MCLWVIIIGKACRSGLGGSSSSTSGRNNQNQIDILAEPGLDSWNSFEPLGDDELESYIKDNFVSKLSSEPAQPRLPIPGIVQPPLERRRRSAQNSGVANMLSRVSSFLSNDLDTLETDLNSSDHQAIMYMNNRVDQIMHSVHGAMEHSGVKTIFFFNFPNIFVQTWRILST